MLHNNNIFVTRDDEFVPNFYVNTDVMMPNLYDVNTVIPYGVDDKRGEDTKKSRPYLLVVG